MINHSASVKAEENCLLIEPGNHRIELPHPVAEFIREDSVIIVRVEPPVGTVFNENVFGISLAGKLVWQIKTLKHVYEDSPYTSIRRIHSAMQLSNWDGDDVVIEPSTGNIVSVGYSK